MGCEGEDWRVLLSRNRRVLLLLVVVSQSFGGSCWMSAPSHYLAAVRYKLECTPRLLAEPPIFPFGPMLLAARFAPKIA